MGIEELIPGLLRAMEERLGPFGRPLTTVLVLFIAAMIIVWGAHVIMTKGVLPVMDFAGVEVTFPDALRGLHVILLLPVMLALTVAAMWAGAFAIAIFLGGVLNRLQSVQNRRDRLALEEIRSAMLELPELSEESRSLLESMPIPPTPRPYQIWLSNVAQWVWRKVGKG